MSTGNTIRYPYKLAVQESEPHFAGPSIWLVQYRCFSQPGKILMGVVVDADNERHAAMRVAAQRHRTGPWIEVIAVEQLKHSTYYTERLERLIDKDISAGEPVVSRGGPLPAPMSGRKS